MSESRVRENRMHGSMRRREATTASRASTRRAAAEASRRPYNDCDVKLPAKRQVFVVHKSSGRPEKRDPPQQRKRHDRSPRQESPPFTAGGQGSRAFCAWTVERASASAVRVVPAVMLSQAGWVRSK